MSAKAEDPSITYGEKRNIERPCRQLSALRALERSKFYRSEHHTNRLRLNTPTSTLYLEPQL